MDAWRTRHAHTHTCAPQLSSSRAPREESEEEVAEGGEQTRAAGEGGSREEA